MDHVALITKIIEAEHQAQKMANEAREKQLHLHEDLRENTEAMRLDYMTQAKDRIVIVREREEKATEEKLEALDVLHQIEMGAMEKLFAENRTEWTKTIFDMIAGS